MVKGPPTLNSQEALEKYYYFTDFQKRHIYGHQCRAVDQGGLHSNSSYLLGYEKLNDLDHVITLFELSNWLNSFARSVLTHEEEKLFLIGQDFGAVTSYAALTQEEHAFSHYIVLAVPPLRTYLSSFFTHPVPKSSFRASKSKSMHPPRFHFMSSLNVDTLFH